MATPSELVVALDSFNLEQCIDNPTCRLDVIESAKSVIARLESPFERVFYGVYPGVTVLTICRIFRDLGIWKAWREAGGKDASLEELRALGKPSDINLLRRLLRVCTGAQVVKELGEDQYGSTPLSLALGDSDDPVEGAVDGMFPYIVEPLKKLPSFLALRNWENPIDPQDNPYIETAGHKPLFDSWAGNPELQNAFMGMMVGTAVIRKDWTDVFDTNTLVEGFDLGSKDSGLLFVDIGGARGVDVQRLLDKQPQIPAGRLAVEDLPDVVAKADLGNKVQCVGHDFFKPHPEIVAGARAYFLHSVLHDWDDENCRRILKQLVGAMKPGHSRILICDIVMPATGASYHQANQDIAVMMLVSAGERTEAHWKELLRSAGLEIVKVWRRRHSPDSVIEAVPVEGQRGVGFGDGGTGVVDVAVRS